MRSSARWPWRCTMERASERRTASDGSNGIPVHSVAYRLHHFCIHRPTGRRVMGDRGPKATRSSPVAKGSPTTVEPSPKDLRNEAWIEDDQFRRRKKKMQCVECGFRWEAYGKAFQYCRLCRRRHRIENAESKRGIAQRNTKERIASEQLMVEMDKRRKEREAELKARQARRRK